MRSPTIRPATSDDVPALADLPKRTWSDAFGSSVSAEDEAAELGETRSVTYFEDALRRDTILVAETDVLVGYVEFGDVNIPGLEARPGDRELRRIYVETERHGRGLGRRLMNTALRHPRLANARRIYLTVWEQNERALRLYERLGFRRVGTVTFTIGSEVAEDLLMLLDRSD